MATTQPEDIPQTNRSRSQHFSFHAVSFEDILSELQAIATKENVGADETALALLAEAGDGSMRDALSIMDQAIASAPVQDGKAVLDAGQIRELMGTVPNTVFEKLLEQIGENQSAAVLQETNSLLNAGNSPSQIARQFVRYLRNCLMAKLGGENTPLLEISADERARASRSAVLFTEEDLTRFLQVMLRTFDELNYRQEPRFHLELGLMKLVHLQRLIPVEELLSQVTGRSPTAKPAGLSIAAPPARPNAGTSSNTSQPAPSRPSTPIAAAERRPEPVERPSFSPFEADRNRKRGAEEAIAQSTVSGPSTATAIKSESAVAVAEAEAPVAGVADEPSSFVEPVAAIVDASPNPALLEELRRAVALALDAEGHQTASALMAAGNWQLVRDTVEVRVAVKKLMLGLVMNPDAEKIARGVMREAGFAPRLQVIPGDGTVGAASSDAAAQGSVQAMALENPLVKQAQELFRAEVRSVLDLRDKRQP
jgi:DNA polymerase-3 subunit gamma/tau